LQNRSRKTRPAFFRTAVSAIGLLFAILPFTASAEVQVPDTPAGKTLRAFLDAFNSADRARLEAYVKDYDPKGSADGLLSFRNQTGGFNLLSIERSTPEFIAFRVRGLGDNLEAYGSFRLESTTPPRVKSWMVRALMPGAVIDDITLDDATRGQAMDAIAARITEYYIYPETGEKMIAAMREHAKKGDYSAITDGNDFADALTRDLRAVSHDLHLHVGYQPFKMPAEAEGAGPHAPRPDEISRYRSELERSNCSFSKVEILPQNIGYLKFDEFADPGICGPTVTAAMNFLGHVDAVIVDMRENHGGAPNMVQLVASYFFEQPTHINDLYDRHENATTQYWTLAYVPGPRLATQPVYVLTSRHTFSGAEEFTYDMQTQKRATIVGEVTGGGAHPVRGVPAGDHFMIGVPFARPVNPVTKTDWEGKGIEPDVKVAAEDALTTAQKLAQEKLLKK
jgi:hypothetical protein